jgi:hypothetical protein
MRRSVASAKRGRPSSTIEGAIDAFDAVERFRQQNGLTPNALAIRFGITPSSVGRCLSERSKARWTPTLKSLYRNALNEMEKTVPYPALQRLARYAGPAEPIVRRLLGDMEELVSTLSKEKTKGRL